MISCVSIGVIDFVRHGQIWVLFKRPFIFSNLNVSTTHENRKDCMYSGCGMTVIKISGYLLSLRVRLVKAMVFPVVM